MIWHGAYRWFPRKVGFRNDYCMTCRAPRRAEQVRTFDVLHLNLVPVLPLGFRRRWVCQECGLRPRQVRLTLRLIAQMVLVASLIEAATFWGSIFFVGLAIAEDVDAFWFLGVICSVVAVALGGYLIFWPPAGPSYEELRQSVPAANDTKCPFCGTPLIDEFFDCHCPDCGAKRL